jgi:hypothetical protein
MQFRDSHLWEQHDSFNGFSCSGSNRLTHLAPAITRFMMMPRVALLIAIITAALTIAPSEGKVKCFKYYARSEAGTSGKNVFTGVTNGVNTENFNIPVYYTVPAALASFKASNPAYGRLSG